MLRFFSLLKHTLVKIIKLGIKAYKARERIYKLSKRFALLLVNGCIIAIVLMFDVVRRGLILVAKPLPRILRLLVYYLCYPVFGKTIQTRLFLRPHLDLETLFLMLKERNINYVVLRWFDKLPYVGIHEDIDLLLADNHLAKISDLFTCFPVGQSFDIYTVSGVENTSYKGLPYYPSNVAERILASRVLYQDLYFVPDTLHYFLSLAYHAIYHKGKLSGLRNENGQYFSTPDHNYELIFRQLAEQLEIQIDLTFFGIHNYLQDNDWTPNMDTLRKLSANDSWIAKLLPPNTFDVVSDEIGEFMVFVLRDWVLLHNKMDFILEKLSEKKLDIILVKMLTEKEREKATISLRGGKWDKGPFPVDGGKPRYMVACFDYHPVSSSKRQQKSHPFVKNKNVFIKIDIRNEINGEKIWFYWTNCIHTADDEVEAWDYIQQVLPQSADTLREQVQKRRDLYKTDFPVLKEYQSNHTRAKVELIDYHGAKAVKKTYKLGYERFCKREIFAYQHFGRLINTLPKLMDAGENYLITKWYENSLDNYSDIERNVILEKYGKEIIKTMRLFFDEGYALIDFYPGNIIVTPGGDVKIIDIEFLYKYKIKPNSFAASYDIKGLPADFDGDLPLGTARGSQGRTYNNTWRFIFGPLKKYMDT